MVNIVQQMVCQCLLLLCLLFASYGGEVYPQFNEVRISDHVDCCPIFAGHVVALKSPLYGSLPTVQLYPQQRSILSELK